MMLYRESLNKTGYDLDIILFHLLKTKYSTWFCCYENNFLCDFYL